MILNSENLINTFIIKYVNKPTEIISKQSLKKKKYLLQITDKCDIFEDKNYAIILSNLSFNEQKMFIRFFNVYLYRVYSLKHTFYDDNSIYWEKLNKFIMSNKMYSTLFLSCFHFFF